jgi:hypothetical protein
MTPPHIWENVLVHSATLFAPTGDKVRLSREEPAQALERYQRYLCQGEGRRHTCQVGRWGAAPPQGAEARAANMTSHMAPMTVYISLRISRPRGVRQ